VVDCGSGTVFDKVPERSRVFDSDNDGKSGPVNKGSVVTTTSGERLAEIVEGTATAFSVAVAVTSGVPGVESAEETWR